MAEESDYSRTEPASERRLAQARAEGSVPRSNELSSLLVLGVMVGGFAIWGVRLFEHLRQLYADYFRTVALSTTDSVFRLIQVSAIEIFPFLLGLMLAALVAPLLLSGWVFAPGVMEFRGERLNPWAFVYRAFSANGMFDAFKAILKILLLGGTLFAFYHVNLDSLAELGTMPMTDSVAFAGNLLVKGLLWMLGAVFLIALLDAPWQWWRYLRGLAMTRAEVLAEAREAEGSPELKARIRARQHGMRQGATE